MKRFGALPPALAGRLADADSATLEGWIERILEVGSPDELLSS